MCGEASAKIEDFKITATSLCTGYIFDLRKMRRAVTYILCD